MKRQNQHYPGFIFLLSLLLILSAAPAAFSSAARESLTMYLGEVQVMKMDMIERVAIGNPSVASNSILPQGQLVILADAVGVTTMHIWLKDGTEKDLEITVLEKKTMDRFQELDQLLNGVKDVKAVKIGELVVVRGKLSSNDQEQYSRIMQRYKGVLDLVTQKSDYSEITTLLQMVPGLEIKEVGGRTVISGEISSEYEKLLQIVEKTYPHLMNLTRVKQAVAGKMIYMKVRIMEVNKSITEQLGINWGDVAKGIAGPSFEFGVETVGGGATILNGPNTSEALKKTGKTSLTTASGYFGIATGIFSTLDLLESTGDAVLLAEPRLSTRSGGKAEFLAGGEFPMPTTSGFGQTNVEFKKYGIQLNIEPVVDDDDNILAHVETEVSTIDESNAVQQIPAILSRKTTTDISMRPNETLVIAGLLNEQASKASDGIKWLRDIPVLGALFRSKNFLNKRSELVIFVTPYIYDASSLINRENLKKMEVMQKVFNNIVKDNQLILD